jgi:D-beta-D-heptose 7-phosphate kinase/D-beta-D-heptose 1-phosphate adenosyltransferase
VRLLVVGDVVLDEYLRGEVKRISPEAPVPVLHVQSESIVLGGAGNVVRNIVALSGQCDFCAVVGDDEDGKKVMALLDELEVESTGLVHIPGRPTTRKTRVMARSQQITRVDRETCEPIPGTAIERLVSNIQSRLPEVAGAVVEDYGKGVLTADSIRQIMAACKRANVPVAVDPKVELEAFRGATLMKPNLREAEALTGLSAGEPGGLDEIARRLRTRLDGSDLVVTRGGKGMSLFERDYPRVDVPTVSQEVYDVQGAGDTTIAILALALAAGASLLEAAVLANAGAGIVVEKTGTATASQSEVLRLLPDALTAAQGA